MIILRTNTFSQDFIQDGFLHSRKPNTELTEKVKDLEVSVSTYTCENVKGEMEYMDIWLNENPEMYFWLGNFDTLPENNTEWHGWGIHFRTYQDNNRREENQRSVLGEKEKQRLFQATARLIKPGERLSTYGTITPGGLHGLLRFKDLGFKQVGIAYPKDETDKTKEIAVPILEKI